MMLVSSGARFAALRFRQQRQRNVVRVGCEHDCDLDTLRCVWRFRDEHAAQMRVRAARRGDRDCRGPVGLRTHSDRLAANVLHLARDEGAHVVGHDDRGVFGRRHFRGRRIRSSRDALGVRTVTSADRLELLVANMIAMRVAQQHDVDVAEARIVATGDGMARVVEDAHARRILEDRRTVVRAQLAGMRADRSDLDVLCDGRSSG